MKKLSFKAQEFTKEQETELFRECATHSIIVIRTSDSFVVFVHYLLFTKPFIHVFGLNYGGYVDMLRGTLKSLSSLNYSVKLSFVLGVIVGTARSDDMDLWFI